MNIIIVDDASTISSIRNRTDVCFTMKVKQKTHYVHICNLDNATRCTCLVKRRTKGNYKRASIIQRLLGPWVWFTSRFGFPCVYFLASVLANQLIPGACMRCFFPALCVVRTWTWWCECGDVEWSGSTVNFWWQLVVAICFVS